MRCEPHPVSGAVYEELGDGTARVTDKAKGKSGVFKWTGEWVEGDLTQADLHFLRFIAGPTLPAEKDIFWTMLPVEGLSGNRIQTNLPPSRGGIEAAGKDKAAAAQRPKIIAPYVGDAGKMTDDGMRASSQVPMSYLVENDRRPDLLPDAYRQAAPYPGGPKKVPVARFLEKKYHDLEVEKMWSKVWQMACRADDIPEVGDYILYKIATREFIVVRTAEDTFKAYPNSCLHRGRRICNHDGKKAALFRCPYHGWSWNIDGSMKEMTCEWDFPGVREDVNALPEAKVAVWGGFVFINPDPDAMSFEEYAGPVMLDHYKKLKLENRYKQAHVGRIIRANWKLMMEAFLEAYHSIATHPQLLLSGGDLTDTRYDVFGNWSRLGHINASGSSPLRGIVLPPEKSLEMYRGMADFNRQYLQSLIGEEVEQYSDAELVEQTFNNLFPNFSPWGGWARIVYRFRPNGDNPEECIMEAMLLAPWPEGKPKPPAAKLRMLDRDEPWVTAEELGTLARIFDQDCGNVPDTHEGLKSKQPPYVWYSAYQESIIRGFHDKYEKLLGLEEGE